MSSAMSESSHGEHYPKELRELALKLLTNGPHKVEKTPRRVRVLFDGIWILDTTSARHVWEHPYYPQYYVPTSAITGADLKKNKAVDDDGSVYFAELDSKGSHPGAYTDRVLIFEKGPLTGLTRLDFGTMDAWFEEDTPIYGHPKDPYKRIDILPSSRRITVKLDGIVVADSTMNMYLFETGLRPRYYMPKTAIQWQYTTPSDTTSLCPYKGRAEYYNLKVNGKEIKDGVWWYRYPTHESAQVAGMACFYNEKVEVFVDGEKEES